MKTLIIALAGVLILGSCSTTHSGMDYSQHRKKGAKLQKQAVRRNSSGDLTKWRCSRHRP
jgi:outer membrane protein assembly factor BamE (lipoprotein component of BamABCDE complex)